MKCNYCGEENGQDNKFCQKCGAQLENEDSAKSKVDVDEIKNKSVEIIKKIPNKVIGIAVSCIAAILVLVILVNLFKADKYILAENDILSAFDSSSEQTSIVYDTKLISSKIEGEVALTQYSLDGKTAAVSTLEGELYFINKSGISKVADSVKSFVLSQAGQGIVYIDEDDFLFLYSIKDKKSVKIEEDVATKGMCISPDGKTVLYTILDEGEEGESSVDLYLYKGKKSDKLGSNLVPIAVSNSAKYVYSYNNENDSLYVSSGTGERTKLAADIGAQFLFNKDNTQIGFTADGKAYVSVKGGDKVKVSNSSLSPVLPLATGETLRSNGLGTSISIAVNDLLEMVYMDISGDLYYIDKKGESDKITGNVFSVNMSADGKTLYYLKTSGTLFKTEVKDYSEPLELAEDVARFVITPDGQYAYYIDDSDSLWAKKGKKDAVRIADEVSDLVATSKNTVLFISDYSNNSGILYSSKNGKGKKQINDDAYRILTGKSCAYYYANYSAENKTCDIFVSSGNDSFSEVIKEAG